jgi:hypothetical protein
MTIIWMILLTYLSIRWKEKCLNAAEKLLTVVCEGLLNRSLVLESKAGVGNMQLDQLDKIST